MTKAEAIELIKTVLKNYVHPDLLPILAERIYFVVVQKAEEDEKQAWIELIYRQQGGLHS